MTRVLVRWLLMHTHTRTHALTHVPTHARTYERTHVRTHARTRTYTYSDSAMSAINHTTTQLRSISLLFEKNALPVYQDSI